MKSNNLLGGVPQVARARVADDGQAGRVEPLPVTAHLLVVWRAGADRADRRLDRKGETRGHEEAQDSRSHGTSAGARLYLPDA